MAKSEPIPACLACGRPLLLTQGRGRPRLYCNATCRSAARRDRKRADRQTTPRVNAKLTPDSRHDSLDVMQGTAGATGPEGAGAAAPGREDLPVGEPPLVAIAAARRLLAVAEVGLQQAVDRARAAGHSWREIGDVLETSRQAAFQRFGRPVDPRTGAPVDLTVPAGMTDKAIKIFADMAAGRWERARQDFGEVMRSRLSADRLADGWVRTIGMIGSFERMGEALAYPVEGGTIVDIPLYFEAGERTGRVSLDDDAKVVGLFIRPASA
jgi:hypothetical protein